MLPSKDFSMGIGFSAKDSSDFLQVPWKRGSVEQRRAQVKMNGLQTTFFKSNLAVAELLSRGVFRCQ